MTGMLLVIITLIANQGESMVMRQYGEKHGKGGMFFNAILCAFATIYFFVTDKNGLQFVNGIWIYGFFNSFLYAIGFYAAYIALKTGSFGLTRLFTSFGIIINVFYGVIFLNEPTTFLTYIALLLVLISMVLINYQNQNDATQKISPKWVISVLLIIISNAASTIIGRIQHGIYADAYDNEFLIISLAGASISLFILGAVFERDNFKPTMKYGVIYGASAGILNGIGSLLVLVTYNYLPISFTSPVKAALGIVLSFVVSVAFYKEKFNQRQLLSAFIGVVAVVLMNIQI